MVTLWEDERHVGRTLDSGDPRVTAVPIVFTIPSDAKGTDPLCARPVSWTLRVSADAPGPDYEAGFEVPVFLTDESRDGVTSSDEPLSEYEGEPSLEALLARDRIRLERRGPDELLVVAPPLRFWGTALAVSAVTILWFGVVVGLFVASAWIIAGFTGLFGLVGLFAMGETLLNGSRLEVSGERWKAVAGWYGVRRTWRFQAGDIRRIKSDSVMTSSSSDGESRKWVRLVAHLASGKQATVVTYISNRKAEKALLAELRRVAGLDRRGKPRKDGERTAASGQWQDVMDLPAEED